MMSRRMRYLMLLGLVLSLVLPIAGASQAPRALLVSARPMVLHYDRPASIWMTEGLPIGNGELGAMLMGGVDEERVQFNEKTLWTGSPSQRGAYQSFGVLTLKMQHAGSYKDYTRRLDLDRAIASVQYTTEGGIRYTRTYLASHPEAVIAIRLSASQPGCLSFSLELDDARPGEPTSALLLGATALRHGAVSHVGTLSYTGCLETLSYRAEVRLVTSGGAMSVSGSQLSVQNADEAYIYIGAGTNYELRSPSYTQGDLPELEAKQQKILSRASELGYEGIRTRHEQDYRELYDRVRLRLTPEPEAVPEITTDRLLVEHRTHTYLDELYYQYGRYLLIASSRGLDLPNNLQGLWNESNTPPWESDIHTNINIQMNYWPAEVTGLAECHLPFLRFISHESQRRGGGMQRVAEREGLRGWTLCTQSTIFSHTDWHINRPANAWYSMHLWQHYAYTGDKQYLSEVAIGPMVAACQYWFDRLRLDTTGHYIAPAEWSPEHGPWEDGVAYAQQLVYELFRATLKASEVLPLAPSFVAELRAKYARLNRGIAIGAWGQLREWRDTQDDPQDRHRHLSHLIALYPGHQISYHQDPKVADAARRSLEARGDEGTGWSRAWKIALWARLGDGERAYQLLKSALNYSRCTTLSMATEDGGVYANLLDAHPPFQIDGNLGATAGITEMLLQSHQEVLELLPALPRAWASGAVIGLRANGGFEVALEWESMQLRRLVVKSLAGGTLRLRWRAGLLPQLRDATGQELRYQVEERGLLSFPTQEGQTYYLEM